MATTSNNIPQGYKATALGIIPQEWEVKFLGDLLSRCANGLTYDVSITSGIPVTRIETISTGEINYAKVGYIPNESGYETFRMQKGDILYSHINSLSQIGKVAYYKGDKEIYHGMNLLLLRANKSLDKQYLYYTLLTDHMRHMAQVIAKPAVNQASISTSDLKRVKIAVPPLGEQRKIAEVLGVWDEAIEKQARLIEKLALRKRALMQRLLSAKLRLPGFSEPWKIHKLQELFTERNETNRTDLPLLSITGDRGVILQTESEKRDTSNDDKSKYKRIAKGDIGYNTMRMWQGRSALSGLEGIVSPAYTIVVPNTDVDGYYMSVLFKQPRLIYDFWTHSQGLVGDTLNCKYRDFGQVHICCPPLAEQKAITEVLTAADREIELAKEKLERLRRQKRGLMQQLLTGKKRI